MKKIFISYGMNGKSPVEIRKKRNEIEDLLLFFENDYEIIDSYLEYEPDPVKCLAHSINLMADADVIYFVGDWEKFRGCRAEHFIAAQYGLNVKYLM